jgi:hypothetical protein
VIIIKVKESFEAWKIKPIHINQWANFYNDTLIRLRREKLDKKDISSTELCWLAYARYLDSNVAPDEIVFDAGTNKKLAEFANLWFGDDSVLLSGRPLCK